jgi:flagellar hook-basal body protein
MPSFYIPLSGLNADNTALNTIANNLSNMNTTGFKAQTTNFSDLFYQQVGTTGSGDQIQQGTGVQVASNSTDFTGGSIASTGVTTDAAIDGAGFFVLDNGGGAQLYTRDGNFQLSSTGTLESTEGQGVMGYTALNGVINTNGGLTDIAIPTGQVMQPSATTSFSVTQNLNSASAIGTQTTGQVQIYDSLGKSYEATVTYTNLGNNKWSYAITLPDTLTAAAATAAAATIMPVTASTPAATAVPTGAAVVLPAVTTVPSTVTAGASTTVTTTPALTADTTIVGSVANPAITANVPVVTPVVNSPLAVQTVPAPVPANALIYNFEGTGATVNNTTNLALSIPDGVGGFDIVPAPTLTTLLPQPVTVAAYATALNTAITTIYPASAVLATPTANGQLSITGGATISSGGVSQNFSSTAASYNFAATGWIDPAALNPATGLTITGPSVSGANATSAVPVAFTGPPGAETVSDYATDLNTALTTAGIVGVTVTGVNATGQLSITGPSTMVINNAAGLKQEVAETTTNYNLVTSNGAQAMIDPSTTLGIKIGAAPTITAPAFTAGESVSAYAGFLQAAVGLPAISGVTITGSDITGQLSITGPANMTIVPGANGLVQNFSGSQTNYSFGSYTDPTTGLSAQAKVAASSTLKIHAPTVNGVMTTTALPIFTPTGPGVPPTETVSDYAGDLTTALNLAGITGVTITANALTGLLSIVGPSSMVISGNVNQDMVGTTNNYNFETNATVDPTTNLKITGDTVTGTAATIIAPQVAAGETVAQYATALTSALSNAGIQNIAVSSAAGQLSIVGANMAIGGTITQDLADTTINYDFGSSATVDATTALTIVGPTVTGVPPTAITAVVTGAAGETVAQYATALSKALTLVGIDTSTDGVSVTANGGQLSIVGPANTLKVAGTASQDLSATTINYNLGTSGGIVATIDPSTNLTISGQTSGGVTATTAAPTVTSGETLAAYVTALTSALTTAGIAGVTVSSTAAGQLSITGANLSTSGNIVQNPVASANAAGTLTFNSNGNLISPAANPNNITFTGLADSAAPMNMTWDLFTANGAGEVSQTAAVSGQSAQNQNGYTSGEYQSFTIGSSGIVTATYSNGQSQSVGQLAIATVSNQQGLVDKGSTQYQATSSSGLATVGVAGAGGRGTLEGSSLEASNVNISSEFSDLIVAQRAFEANAKSVTTFDTITQETINMIH